MKLQKNKENGSIKLQGGRFVHCRFQGIDKEKI